MMQQVSSHQQQQKQTMSESNSCPSYFQMGYCLRGNDCPFAHDEHAVNVPEMEFFFGWELADSFVQQYKKDCTEQLMQEEEKKKQEAKLLLEQERDRIRKNAEVKKKQIQMEDEENRERKRLEKLEKRKREQENQLLQNLQPQKLQKQQQQRDNQGEEAAVPVVENIEKSQENTVSANATVVTSECQVQPNGGDDDENVRFSELLSKYEAVNWSAPRIPLSIHYHVPANFRQKILEKLIVAYETHVFKNEVNKEMRRQKSVLNSFETELDLYNKHKDKSAYWINSSSFVTRLATTTPAPWRALSNTNTNNK